MIKFFRKIRQNMLSENKFSKYLIYAIGEILLVVIGILIALSINNWNDKNKNRKQERQVLLQLKEEYKENLTELDLKISMRKEMLEASSRLLAYYDNNDSWKAADSVASDFTLTFYTPTFNPVIGVTSELLSSGKLYIIENNKLKLMLTNWTGVSSRLIEYEEDLRSQTENHYNPYFKENHSYRKLFNGFWDNEILDSKRQDKSELINELINDKNLEDYIITVAASVVITEKESEIVRKHITDILEIVNLELSKK
jgi:hypothetical protein